jgi:cytochrome c peroxidase
MRLKSVLFLSLVIAASILSLTSCDKEKVSENAKVTLGRELFNSTKFDPNHTLSCASCHPGGDMDHKKWKLTGFPDTLATPTLFGAAQTAPYGWFEDRGKTLRDVADTVIVRILQSSATSDELDALEAYMNSLVVPSNPWVNSDGSLTDAQARGKIVFENQGKCINCHSGEIYTGLFKVRTRVGKPLVDVPSLRWEFATAPYFYDNSKQTLMDVINYYADSVTTAQMVTWGWNSWGVYDINLTQDEKNDLLEYLRTL